MTAAPLRVPPRILLGPGPSPCPPEVLRAMATPLLGHLDPAFLAIMDETSRRLREVFRTSNRLTLPLPGTGSAGMEAAIVNFLEPGDRAVIGVNGVFGARLKDQAERIGVRVEAVEAPFGETLPIARLREATRRERTHAVVVVHAETSTGALQDLTGVGELCRESDALFVLDCVTSLGGVDVRLDDWGVDAAYSGSQKCLSAPPGLSPASFSERALAKLRARKTKVPSWYLDLGMIAAYWGGERAYHHTAPISMIFALHEALGLVLDEGLEASFARHRRVQEFLLRGLADLGLEPFVPAERRLPMLTAINVPAGVDEAAVRRDLYARFGVEIGGGLGPLKGKVWRIGHMGHGAREENMLAVLGALRELLKP
jgi:alanine-glyoxylate transaminase / serine-glyoxylate transaminase / serine-pyruvate transaminase